MAPTRPDVIEYLTGRLSGTPRPPGISLLNGGGKFTPDGAVQTWPGNTFICHIDRATAAFEAIREMQEAIKKSPFNRFFTFLPPPSLHMTVLQGVSPHSGPGNGWPIDAPETMTLDELTSFLVKRLDGLGLPASYRIKFDGLFGGYSLTVSGADERERAALHRARVALRDATGITFPDFDNYVHHITLAYLIDWLSEQTAKELAAFNAEIGDQFKEAIGIIDLSAVEFCDFQTMHHFELVRAIT